MVRVSGPRVPRIARAILGCLPAPRRAILSGFCGANGQAIDRGLALYFAAPASFTGEHVLELHGHGSPILVDMMLERVVALGARLAGPGEFSARAFFNDKLSLDQAEAIADAISAGSRVAARAAVRSLEGAFAREVDALVEAVTALRIYTEAAIDFPDEEDVDFRGEGDIEHRLQGIIDELDVLRSRAAQGTRFREGLRLLILGRPNVGKSSLLNRLARRETAIVTELAGTTRDILHEELSIDGIPLTLVDTAGLSETDDPIEAEGMRRARAEIAGADQVLWLIDDREGLTDADRTLLTGIDACVGVTLIANKVDLSGAAAGKAMVSDRVAIRVAAIDGRGFDALTAYLKSLVGVTGDAEPDFVARRRHLAALDKAAVALAAGRERLVVDAAGDLLAEELRTAQTALGEITGQVTSEDLLGEIFSSFCIGK